MIGIVLVTHGRLAAEFRAALEHVVGPQKQIESTPDWPISIRRKDPLRYVLLCSPIDSGNGGRPPDAERLAGMQEYVIRVLTEHSGRRRLDPDNQTA